MSGIAPKSKLSVPLTLSIAVVLLLVVAAVPGLFVSGFYHDTPSIMATNRGSDLLTLIVVVPALAVSIFYGRRGSLRAQIVWLALIAWIAYNYVIYAYGVNFTRASLAYVAILSLAIFTIVLVIRRVDTTGLEKQFQPSMPRRVFAVYLWLVAAIFSFLWLADIVPASLNGSVPARLAALHATSNPVEINDLAIIIPTLVLAGIWTWQRRPLGYLLSGILLGVATITMAALLPGGPIFAGQTLDPIYGGIALVSFIVWMACLINVKETVRNDVLQPVQARSGPSIAN